MGELAAAIAHEVKQPLTAVAMAAGTSQRYLARDPPDLGKARESLATISDEAQRAAAVIERIRSLVAKSVPAKSRVDVNETIREVLALAKAEADRHRIVVRTDLGPGLPPVLADRVQLEQVLLNLLVNGIHAMTAISERPRELRIESRQAGSEVTVAVEDRGVGVAPEMIDRIFEPFFTTKPDGMGMGLAISRRILELYGGRLWFSAIDGGGASFQFALPCEPAAEQGVLT
jgi:C4-dicarboxylate-specific signal transduction histidine kinase